MTGKRPGSPSSSANDTKRRKTITGSQPVTDTNKERTNPLVKGFTHPDKQHPYSTYLRPRRVAENASDRARRYGCLDETIYTWFQGGNGNKSGLSPIQALRFDDTKTQYWEKKWNELDQVRWLYGFTAQELKDMNSFVPLYDGNQLEESNIQHIGVHPVLSRANWIDDHGPHAPAYPLAKGRPGYWTASNDHVWTVLEPILQIVTKLITNMHITPFFDALMQGVHLIEEPRHRWPFRTGYREPNYRPRKIIRTQPGKPNEPFPVKGYPKTKDLLSAFWTENQTNIRFLLTSSKTRPASGLPSKPRGAGQYGSTYRVGDTLHCALSFHLLEPLLWDLTAPERMCQQTFAAITLIHELSHAMTNVVMTRHQPDFNRANYPEPFFENDIQAEMGFAMENHVFGGHLREPNQHSFESMLDPLELGGLCLKDDLNRTAYQEMEEGDVQYKRGLTQEEIPLTSKAWPIPMFFFSNLQRAEFWDVRVAKFGAASLRYDLGSNKGTETEQTTWHRPKASDFEAYWNAVRDITGRWKRCGESGYTALEHLNTLTPHSPFSVSELVHHPYPRNFRWYNNVNNTETPTHADSNGAILQRLPPQRYQAIHNALISEAGPLGLTTLDYNHYGYWQSGLENLGHQRYYPQLRLHLYRRILGMCMGDTDEAKAIFEVLNNTYTNDEKLYFVVYEANYECHLWYLVEDAAKQYRQGQDMSTVLYEFTPDMDPGTWRAFGVPENTLYRWVIQQRPDLNLTPEDFHAYLVDCNRSGGLFEYSGKIGCGMVMRRRVNNPLPGPADIHVPQDTEDLEDEEVQDRLVAMEIVRRTMTWDENATRIFELAHMDVSLADLESELQKFVDSASEKRAQARDDRAAGGITEGKYREFERLEQVSAKYNGRWRYIIDLMIAERRVIMQSGPGCVRRVIQPFPKGQKARGYVEDRSGAAGQTVCLALGGFGGPGQDPVPESPQPGLGDNEVDDDDDVEMER